MKRTKSYLIISLFLATSSLYAQRIKGSDTVLPVSQQAAENFIKNILKHMLPLQEVEAVSEYPP